MSYDKKFKEKIIHLYIDKGITLRELSNKYNVSYASIINWTKELRKTAPNKNCVKRYDNDFKKKVVIAHLEGCSLRALAKEYDVPCSTIENWVIQYKSIVEDLEIPRKTPNQYSEGLRLDMVYLHVIKGCTFKSLAKDFGISDWSIRKWCKKYKDTVIKATQHKYSLEFKKKVVSLFLEKGATLEELYEKYSLKESTVNKWVQQLNGDSERESIVKIETVDLENPRNTQYTEEFKKKMVKLAIEGKSYEALVKEYRVSLSSLLRWYKFYRDEVLKELAESGQTELLAKVKATTFYRQGDSVFGRRYSEEFKKDIVRQIIEGKSLTSLEKESGVSYPTLLRWDSQYKDAVLKELAEAKQLESQPTEAKEIEGKLKDAPQIIKAMIESAEKAQQAKESQQAEEHQQTEEHQQAEVYDRYSEEFSKKIVRMLIGGWRVSDLMKEYKLNESLIRHWDRKYRDELINSVAEDNVYNDEKEQPKEEKSAEANVLANNPDINLEVINEYLCAILNQSDTTEQGTDVSLAKYRAVCMSAKKLEKERVGLLKQNVELQKRNTELNKQLLGKDRELLRKDRELSELGNQLASKDAQLSELSSQLSELSGQLSEKDTQISKFHAEVSRLQEEITILEAKVTNNKQRDNYFREVFSRLIKEVEE